MKNYVICCCVRVCGGRLTTLKEHKLTGVCVCEDRLLRGISGSKSDELIGS